jgi:GNAT superfamily N-acetyltransferase
MDLAWRPVTLADVPAWQRLLAAAEVVDQTGESFDTADLLEVLDDPATGIDDKIAAFDADRMAAFAGVRPRDVVHRQARRTTPVPGGLASALLGHAIREYTEHGCDESSLDVDTANPTGAFGLYERFGYRVESRTATSERVIAPR